MCEKIRGIGREAVQRRAARPGDVREAHEGQAEDGYYIGGTHVGGESDAGLVTCTCTYTGRVESSH